MFETLPENFRAQGVHADVRTLLLLQKAFDKNLVQTLGDIFLVLKGIVVKDPKMIGPFTKAFYDYFLGIEILPNEKLNDAIARSEAFKNWKANFDQEHKIDENLGENIEKFLNEVHLSSYDIKKILDGQAMFNQDNPDLEDGITPNEERTLDRMADYSNVSLEDILERMRKIQEKQKTKHTSGSHWIGQGGTSPYGNNGAAKGGVRVAGSGGGNMARAVLHDKNYYPVDLNEIINDDNINAALAALKGVIEESNQDVLDVENTIKNGLKRGGLFLPEIKNIGQQKIEILLFIDNGGYSMTYYVKMVQKLFQKMKTRFAHDMETYYFHNTIYNEVFSDARRTVKVPIEKILSKNPNYCVFFVGDASMAPYELSKSSQENYQKLAKKFKKIVWLNPEPLQYWPHTETLQVIKNIIKMYPMTPHGIELAVREMNRHTLHN